MKLTIRKFAYTLKMWLCTGLAFAVLFMSVVIALISTPHPHVVNLYQAEIEGGD
ncbi:MAG TPA: hypothetical protein V6C95_06750 [Coleofasciculaceae cyanobacterium]